MVLDVEGIEVTVVRKRIKHLYLRVHPPHGEVRISAPRRIGLEEIRAFARSKADWIRRKRSEVRGRRSLRRPPPRYLEGEELRVWGEPYRLEIREEEAGPEVWLEVPAGAEHEGRIVLQVRPGADRGKRHEVVEAWYRDLLRAETERLLPKWEPRIGRTVEKVYVRRMTTRWGTCNHARRTIRLNTELAERPRGCLEYIVVHEMAHLIEPNHSARFYAILDRVMPGWKRWEGMLKGEID